MVVSVQDQVGAGPADHRGEGRGVLQLPPRRSAAGMRRMVDHHTRGRGAPGSVANALSSVSAAASCDGPSRPLATNGTVGIALDRPISATPPLRRR